MINSDQNIGRLVFIMLVNGLFLVQSVVAQQSDSKQAWQDRHIEEKKDASVQSSRSTETRNQGTVVGTVTAGSSVSAKSAVVVNSTNEEKETDVSRSPEAVKGAIIQQPRPATLVTVERPSTPPRPAGSVQPTAPRPTATLSPKAPEQPKPVLNNSQDSGGTTSAPAPLRSTGKTQSEEPVRPAEVINNGLETGQQLSRQPSSSPRPTVNTDAVKPASDKVITDNEMEPQYISPQKAPQPSALEKPALPDKPSQLEHKEADPNHLSVDSVDTTEPKPPQRSTPSTRLIRDNHLIRQILPTPSAAYTGKKRELPPLNEILMVAKDMASAEQQRRAAMREGLRIISRKRLKGLRIVLSVFRVPNGRDTEALIETIRSQFPDTLVERNLRYRLLGRDKKSYGQVMVGIELPSNCQQVITLGMLDSAVASTLPEVIDNRVQLLDVIGKPSLASSHGTAVASLLVSRDVKFPGLLPNAKLYAVNVFAPDSKGKLETRTDWLISGLNELMVQKPAPLAVNLSFGGDYSTILAFVFKRLAETVLFVAAAGNDGDDRLVYPAAYGPVIAVGAVDAKARRMRRSNYGKHIQLVAPGEDIWTRNEKGKGRYISGTSFAAPFATAALAVAAANKVDIQTYIGSLGSQKIVDFRDLCQ